MNLFLKKKPEQKGPYIIHSTPYGRFDKNGRLVPRDHPDSYIPAHEYDEEKLSKKVFIVNKKVAFHHFVKEVIKTMSDRRYQKRVWVKGKGQERDSFKELIKDFSTFVQDLDDFEQTYPEWGLTERQMKIFAVLCWKLKEFLPHAPNSPEILIADSRWRSITKTASVLYAMRWGNGPRSLLYLGR
jgi:hypothetical protein